MTDFQFRITTLLTVLTMCGVAIWTLLRIGAKVSRSLGKFEAVLENFPPHRHVPGGNVVYPAEYSPTPVQKLNGDAKAAGVV